MATLTWRPLQKAWQPPARAVVLNLATVDRDLPNAEFAARADQVLADGMAAQCNDGRCWVAYRAPFGPFYAMPYRIPSAMSWRCVGDSVNALYWQAGAWHKFGKALIRRDDASCCSCE